jgi:hypothetical protein
MTSFCYLLHALMHISFTTFGVSQNIILGVDSCNAFRLVIRIDSICSTTLYPGYRPSEFDRIDAPHRDPGTL